MVVDFKGFFCLILVSRSAIIILPLFQQVRHMFDEIDYVLEGKNAERFATLYSHGEFQNLLIH
jgi:hypothetical protein